MWKMAKVIYPKQYFLNIVAKEELSGGFLKEPTMWFVYLLSAFLTLLGIIAALKTIILPEWFSLTVSLTITLLAFMFLLITIILLEKRVKKLEEEIKKKCQKEDE
jgi:hypothetical protein